MSSGHIIVHASIVAKPEHLEKVREVVTNIRDYARKEEEGTLIYRTSISNENERKFEFFEEYTSKSAFDAHVAGEPFQNLSKNAKEWLEGAPVISLSTEF
ncbi:hypothetical protein HD553DRAFT_303760 [Filobasidium floriforme]|uniref:uncharacterized protein n=1 Tax=Filobasidium floriforme TaxID=5210 RepID=UPI001E8CEC28|nr:uncharacterized protein HD553DRAFT_303760 [Filobasidium floriforme]KAH8090941.1 hypothetical protein HD553DRAFT_303760 [Filobasidium floriforme]